MTVHSNIDQAMIDRGTPARESQQTVSLTIDGIPVTVPAGTSVMRASSLAGIQVPKLCATDSLRAEGTGREVLVKSRCDPAAAPADRRPDLLRRHRGSHRLAALDSGWNASALGWHRAV